MKKSIPISKSTVYRWSPTKRALITGVTGQDGSFLAELLLSKGYEVHGLVRRSSTFNTDRLSSIYADPHEQGTSLHLHHGDVTDSTGLRRIFEKAQPDEVIRPAQSSFADDRHAPSHLCIMKADFILALSRAQGRVVTSIPI